MLLNKLDNQTILLSVRRNTKLDDSQQQQQQQQQKWKKHHHAMHVVDGHKFYKMEWNGIKN